MCSGPLIQLLLLLLQGKVEKDSEVLMIMKTQSSLLDALTAKVGHHAHGRFRQTLKCSLNVVYGSVCYT